MRSQRRRSNRRVIRGPITMFWLWSLVALNVVMGIFFSPLTAIKKVRVIGATKRQETEVHALFARYKGVPFFRLPFDQISSGLSSDPEVANAKFVFNIFGRANVRFTLRSPVGRVKGSNVCFDLSGTTFVTGRATDRLPEVVLPSKSSQVSLTLAGPWERVQTAHLCSKLSAQMPKVLWRVELNDRGELSLQGDGGAEVVLGSSEALPQKVTKLKELLDQQPGLLTKVRQLNLTYPDSPMIVR